VYEEVGVARAYDVNQVIVPYIDSIRLGDIKGAFKEIKVRIWKNKNNPIDVAIEN